MQPMRNPLSPAKCCTLGPHGTAERLIVAAPNTEPTNQAGSQLCYAISCLGKAGLFCLST
jgi:hypothetical protein